MINIKVNGITELKQLKQLDGLDIEFARLDFFEGSPWYVKDKLAAEEVRISDFDIKKVGMFVDQSFDAIMQIVDDYALDVVQLNGEENPLLCEQLSETLEVIKVFKIDKSSLIEELIADYDEVCDYYLFDIAGGDKGIEWKQLNKAKIEKPFFLNDAIGPEDSKKVKSFTHPDFFGVDINSQFEKSPGIKDMVSILQFKQSLKK